MGKVHVGTAAIGRPGLAKVGGILRRFVTGQTRTLFPQANEVLLCTDIGAKSIWFYIPTCEALAAVLASI